MKAQDGRAGRMKEEPMTHRNAKDRKKKIQTDNTDAAERDGIRQSRSSSPG